MSYYCQLQEAYGWTVREIDETEMEFLLDQAVVLAKKNHTELQVPVDAVF